MPTVALLFQFPSNGKAYPKVCGCDEASVIDNIMFQFPSNGKAYPKTKHKFFKKNFRRRVSIPFKRESVSKVIIGIISVGGREFQFPSNGKAYPKGIKCFLKK